MWINLIATNCLITTNFVTTFLTANFLTTRYLSQINWTNFFLSISSNNFCSIMIIIFFSLLIHSNVWSINWIHTISIQSWINKFERNWCCKLTRNWRSFSTISSKKRNMLLISINAKRNNQFRNDFNQMNKKIIWLKSNFETKCRNYFNNEYWNKTSKSLLRIQIDFWNNYKSINFSTKIHVLLTNIVSWTKYSRSNFEHIEKIMNDYHFIVLNLVILISYMQIRTQEMCECQDTNFNKNALILFSSNYINWILIATFAQHICENCISTKHWNNFKIDNNVRTNIEIANKCMFWLNRIQKFSQFNNSNFS